MIRRIPALAAVSGGLAALAIAGLVSPAAAEAHGLLLNKRDLPVPEWLFSWAAAIVLIASFVGLSVAWTTTRFQEQHWRPVSHRLSSAIVNPATQVLAGLVSVLLLALVVYSGLAGTSDPTTNFSVTFVFVTFWLGFLLLNVLFGDVFRAFNPWRAIALASAFGFKVIAGAPAKAPLEYPERLGRWPAVAGIVVFAWFELVYPNAFRAVGVDGYDVAVATLLYSVYTLGGMALFGIEKWLDRGEAFSVYFGMFASLAAFEVRDGVLGVRRFLSGATSWVGANGSIAMVLVIIGVTAFDGAAEGTFNDPIISVYDWFRANGMEGSTALRVTNTLFMAGSVAIVFGIYWAGIAGMHSVRGSRPARELRSLFAHAFIPIALAYLVAHYFSLFVFIEQAQFTFLLSDPLGNGSDLFGTANSGVDYTAVSSETIWYIQVGALIVGHVAALVLAHDRALAIYGDSKVAGRSQYWMLTLMVGFTSLGLFLLSQGNS